jgi:mono/diheme cytochrome c family protein
MHGFLKSRLDRAFFCLTLLLVFGAVSAAAYAGSCKIVVPARVVHAPYVAPVRHYAAPVVQHDYGHAKYEVATFLGLYKPSYVGFHVPAPQQLNEDELAKAVQGLTAEINSLKERLGRAEKPEGPKTGPTPAPDPFAPQARAEQRLGAFPQTQAVCAKCHDAAVAAKKGGGLTLTQGDKLAKLSPEQLGEVVRRLTTTDPAKVMPPLSAGKVAAETKLGIIDEVTREE